MLISVFCLKEKNACHSKHYRSLYQLVSLFTLLFQLLNVMLSIACEICQSHRTGSYRDGRQQGKDISWTAQTHFEGVSSIEHLMGYSIPEISPWLLTSRF